MQAFTIQRDRGVRTPSPRYKNQGLSLVVVLLILVVVSILGVGGIQISMLGERATRNDRDTQIAWQSAEAGLIDAELDILGLPATSTSRGAIFKRGQTDAAKFAPGCSANAATLGLCYSLPTNTLPDWLAVDLAESGSGTRSVALGTFTGRTFPTGSLGTQPAAKPRYVIELVEEPELETTTAVQNRNYLYRVTAIGFGPSAHTRGVVQMIYRN
ncbi:MULTISPECIES: PilX N-terminal domain-containing pilus assembly protein [unclassified Acidovorax]|uniref:pilus assembly PilX family protein n=1 Tax=unclassified Acidovorax TaxID=2684926 RepID=UPI00288302DF|nr:MULTISPECIES: PilX N-terminal domain-containing pilus assembly protein [unclassified Acidovorax]